MLSSEQVRAARALLRMEQKTLAQASGVSLPSIKRLEAQPGSLAAQSRTVEAIQTALETAGIEFTNGGQPGVRLKRVWMLHKVAERANLQDVLALKGRADFWLISSTAQGIECRNQHGEMMGSVRAGTEDDPAPVFDPPIKKLMFPDRVVPTELHRWIADMLTRDSARGLKARAFEGP